MPAKHKGAKPMDQSCTCGHNYGCEEDDGTDHTMGVVSQNSMMAQSTAALGSTNSGKSGGNRSPHTNSNRPLDASFVQVPQHNYSSDRVLQQLHQEEQQKHGAMDATSTNNFGKSESYRRLTRLQQTANALGESSSPPPPPLCLSCIQRVEQALDSETQRMYAECQAYREAIRDDKARIKAWRLAVQGFQYKSSLSALSPGHQHIYDEGQEVVSSPASDSRDGITTTAQHDNPQQSMEEAFRNEIALLQEACEQHREELLRFRALQREQQQLELELDRVHEAMSHEQNALELEARAFYNDQEQLSRALLEIQDEVERLSSPKLKLPATLLRLRVDLERGLRYPLINELRLAYRPKGDVQWNEIQAAWALAAQLLLSIGTLFHFQQQLPSNNKCWKLIPLSHCAKLFYYPSERSNISDSGSTRRSAADVNSKTHTATPHNRPVVFNLGHPKTNQSKALLTWNALLCQVIQHVTSELAGAVDLGILNAEDVPPIPFEISPTKIGNTLLTQLGEDDDGGWSRVIHFMSSNLLWLSDCASLFVRQQVVLESLQSALKVQPTVETETY